MTTPARRWLFALALLLAGPAARAADDSPPQVPPRSGSREVIELFNGKNLAGWTGHEKYWSVEDGVIVGRNRDPVPVSTYLLSERKFSDFRLVFDFRLAESEMHSGIALWGRVAPERGDPYTYAGHLVMFPSNYGFYDLYGRNLIHKNADVARPAGHQHGWNRIEILAQGNRIRFVLNGLLVSDWREPEPDRIKEAPIGLQLHSNKVPQEVQFKNLVIETFPEDKLTTLAAGRQPPASHAGQARVYVGTYTRNSSSEGIYHLTLDLSTGRLSQPVLAARAVNPSFLALHPSGRYLYAVGEAPGGPSGAGTVSAFAVDAQTGDLKLINQQSSGGAGPCHLVVDQQGGNVLVANYGGGSAAVLPIRSDGSLGERTGWAQHVGSSANPRRQAGPHAHSINLDPAGRLAFVADLGLDKVLIYRFDNSAGTIAPADPAFASVAPGSGPRHFAFHPGGQFAYVINELASTVTAFRYDPAQGKLTELQTISTLPAGYEGATTTAEVQVHPSGRFLYGSNRGHDSISIFRIDPEQGTLTLVGHQNEQIKVPRNFGIDPTGRFMIVANQAADTLLVFSINPQTGQLAVSGSVASIAAPVCVKMLLLQ